MDRRTFLHRRRSSFRVYLNFLDEFKESEGGWQVLVIGVLLAIGFGTTLGIIPQITTQRYAEELYGYSEDDLPCSSFIGDDKPVACLKGAHTAQTAASYCSVARHILALLFNTIAGSYSDAHGRRGVQILCAGLLAMSPAALFLIQVNKSIHPTWYFVIDSTTTMISLFSIGYAQLSDILEERNRSAAFGLLLGAFYFGLALGSRATLIMDHTQVSLFSFLVRLSAMIFAIVALPETLPGEIAAQNLETRLLASAEASSRSTDQDYYRRVFRTMLRPIREMRIMFRSKTLILVTISVLFIKLVFSADVTLFYFYVESELGVRDSDVSLMFIVQGIAGVVVQAILLKYLISFVGEHRLLLLSYLSGILHNLVYGVARDKRTLYFGLILSQFTNTNTPLLSSLVSRNVDVSEQGQVQGALSALSSLAEAIGPIFFNYVYLNWHVFGLGTMFVVATIVYAFGTFFIALVPPKSCSRISTDNSTEEGPAEDEAETTAAPDESTNLMIDGREE